MQKQIICDETQSLILCLYEQYSRYLYKTAWALCRSSQDVEDLVQTVWERLIPKEEVLRGLNEAQRLNYICTTLKNTLREDARRKKLITCSLEAAFTGSTEIACDIEESIDRELRIRLFHELWHQVNPDVRELLERKYDLGETDEEIARAMGIKVSSVRMYLTRARRSARGILAEHKDQLIG